MPLPPPITLADLTTASMTGTGVFDVLMKANKVHLEEEYSKNRIRGPEYATVYLGSMEATMRNALEFLLQRDKNALEAELLQQQIILAGVQVEKARVELAIAEAQLPKVEAEIKQIEAQTILIEGQTAQLALENDRIVAQTEQIKAQTAQLTIQTELISAQAALARQQKLNLESDKLLTDEKTKNAVLEGKVLIAQECKLRAEFDLTMKTVEKAAQEIALLAQKVITERAQVSSAGVDDNSVVGRQKLLYKAQTDGFARDAEQKAAKILADTWNVRRTTDETGTLASATNRLDDGTIGQVIGKLLQGVGI